MDFSSLPEFPAWLVQVVLIVFITAILASVSRRMLKKLAGKARSVHSVWPVILLEAGRKPLVALIWLTGAGWTVDVIWQSTGIAMLAKFDGIRDMLVIGLFGWVLVRLIREVEKQYLSGVLGGHDNDPTSVVAVGRLLRVTAVIISGLMLMQTLGYSISGILAFGGVGGIAIGFAARDMLANLFGGMMIYLDKPFGVGDWIRSPDKNIEGTVQYIGWRQTRILTFEKRPLYVPNATFMTISVENPSRMENRRIKEAIGLRYRDSRLLAPLLAEIRSYLQEHNEIDQSKIIMVNFNQFGASSLDCFIYCFTRTTDWAEFHMIKERVLLDIMAIIHHQGGDIAFPTRTLDLPEPLSSELNTRAEQAKDVNSV
ncbi:mechanosensitive ion channel family protein [Endozoicomonas gorgoniicola]|uniref:Mechanosensitive ion channel family protein n=1 Tax=Endozoicomonas gorgoniicola TaxID=1234144 RepID=A0ABT3MRJ1_9GAMM|nr:mechanosensitive ion channel family protein [Endozoicomonas gorgoniicola]MCW7551990.1 mechanosensitive ion channel family protein [Endozoicomonas gorgoniicola]